MFQHVLKGLDLLKGIEQTAGQSLQNVLAQLSGFERAILSAAKPSDQGIDFIVELDAVQFVVEVKSRLWPNDVPAIAHQLQRYVRSSGKTRVPIVVAPVVSERAAVRLWEEGISWADFAGNCHIQFDRVLVHVEGRAIDRAASRGTASLFTPKAARVIHALLLRPFESWRVVDLAERTEVSIGQVSNVRKLLVKNAFAEETSEGIRLNEPQKLLLEWSKNYRPRRKVSRYYSLRRPADLEHDLNVHLSSFALTELAAAERYAPFTRYQGVAFYVSSWTPEVAKELELRPAEGTPNVTVYEDLDGLLFAEEKGSVACASPILTYLDLVLLGGRGQDAAEHLFETTIAPRWQ